MVLGKNTTNIDSLYLKLHHQLEGFTHLLNSFAWSPDGRKIAAPSENGSVAVWNNEIGALQSILDGRFAGFTCVSWAQSGKLLACGSYSGHIELWETDHEGMTIAPLQPAGDVQCLAWSSDMKLASGSSSGAVNVWMPKDGTSTRFSEIPLKSITSLAWSPDGRTLAIGSFAAARIYFWTIDNNKFWQLDISHIGHVRSLAWSKNGLMLAAGLSDSTVRIVEVLERKQRLILEGHTDTVISLSFSLNDLLLASKSDDDTIRLWRCDMWETVAVISAPSRVFTNIAFHPSKPFLATLGTDQVSISVWEFNTDILSNAAPVAPSGRYVNAKVVLVGDTGVGKSGLGLVLSGQPFIPTESTHGRSIWTFDTQEIQLDNGRYETRETLLWDMAGQPGYRLIHQLHLNEVSVALVIFDGRSDTDPFAGVLHWNRALRQAHLIQGEAALPMKKFLVSARTDRGGISVSRSRIESLMLEHGFDQYFETSAKEGWQIKDLIEAIRNAVDWTLPKVSSPELFHNMKEFLLEEKQAGRILSTSDDLYRAFLRSGRIPFEVQDLRAEFDICIVSLESRDLIQGLGFGSLILLQPEMLDAYASALVNSAKDEPDGLGSISEENAREGRFRMSESERIHNKDQEKLLLIATVEDLIHHEIALVEQTEHGAQIIFPSQLTRDNPDHPDPEREAVIFTFEGPLLSIYATLAVRLSHSGTFEKKEMWRNAITFNVKVGGTCGMLLHELEEGRGELILFFDAAASEESRFQFEDYIFLHLKRRALPTSIRRRRIYVCSKCETPVSDLQAKRRRERDYDWIECNVCGQQVSLLDGEKRLPAHRISTLSEMDQAADDERARGTAALKLEGKIETNDFDVFMAHNSLDKIEVSIIAEQLKQRGLYPWLDKEQIPPGRWFQDVIQQAIPQVKSAAIFIGSLGLGKWQTLELRSFISQCIDENIPVIPILLPGVKDIPDYLVFLKELNWIRFQNINDSEAIDNLVWGITGKNPQKNFK